MAHPAVAASAAPCPGRMPCWPPGSACPPTGNFAQLLCIKPAIALSREWCLIRDDICLLTGNARGGRIGKQDHIITTRLIP